MCRLTAYLGEPLPVSTLLYGGDHSLLEQAWAPRELLAGSVNADGWGVAWWREGRAVRLARAEPAWYDPGIRDILEGIRSGGAVAALRNATPGLPVGPTAVAPIVRDAWAFVLNGFVPRFRRDHMRALRRDLPDDLYGALEGSTDTETLFLLAVAGVREGIPPAEALEGIVEGVLERVVTTGGADCQLTLLLSDGERLAAVTASNVERANTLYVLEAGRLAPDGVLVASEALDDARGWTRVPPHHLLVVEAGGVRMRKLAAG